MSGFARASRFFCGLLLAVIGSFVSAGGGFAAVEDSRFILSPDGSAVDFELRDVARRDVLARLFADQEIKVDWLDPSLANAPISGGYRGSLSQVARQLLEKVDFILVYDMGGSAPRITRVVVMGPSKGQPSPGLATVAPWTDP